MSINKPMPKFDIGLIWAKYLNIWGQLGAVVGGINTLMMIGVFYSTTIKPNVSIPLWLYLTVMISGAIVVVAFIVKWGISGYYRYFSSQSELTEVRRKVDLIMKHFGIEDDDVKTKM